MSQDIKSIFTSIQKGRCVICGNSTEQALYMCLKCKQPCEIKYPLITETRKDHKFVVIDVKSKCCNSDIENMSRITCSEKCHIKFIEYIEAIYGKDKKITDSETGVSYRVPTKDIIEKGLNHDDLPKYPLWSEKTPRKIPVQ